MYSSPFHALLYTIVICSKTFYFIIIHNTVSLQLLSDCDAKKSLRFHKLSLSVFL